MPDKLVFFDKAVRGCRRRRAGLKALQDALDQDEIDVLLVFSTSRLFRKVYKSLGFVEEEIVDRDKRCVFVKSGIDTADQDRWRQLLHLHSMIDGFVVQMSVSHIRAAHEGLLDREMVHGTLTYGYKGDPVAGELTKRNRPRRRIVIDPVQAEWVRRIFTWYVDEGLTIGQCFRGLNKERAPLPPRCTTGLWTRQAVNTVLSNPRYRGLWQYGDTQAVYLNRQDYVRQVRRETPLKSKQIDRLRIIDEVTWLRAQERKANEPRRGGRKAKRKDRRRRPEFLNALLFCKSVCEKSYYPGARQ